MSFSLHPGFSRRLEVAHKAEPRGTPVANILRRRAEDTVLPPDLRWTSTCPAPLVRLFLLASLTCAQTVFPDPATLLKEVQANQTKMEQIRENYTFHRTLTEQDLDDKGAITKTTTQEREIFFVNGHRIGRLIKKDGVELQGKEEKNEQARVHKLVEAAMKAPPQRRGTGPG